MRVKKNSSVLMIDLLLYPFVHDDWKMVVCVPFGRTMFFDYLSRYEHQFDPLTGVSAGSHPDGEQNGKDHHHQTADG